MFRLALSILLAVILTIAATSAVAACSGLDCLFGWTERAEVNARRDAEIAEINARRDADIAAEQTRAQEALASANAELERIRQQQYATEAERDIAIAREQARVDEYRSMIESMTSEKIAGINSNTNTQIAALQGQAQIAVAGIQETGEAKRVSLIGGWIFSVVGLFVFAVVVNQLIRNHHERQIRVLAGPAYISRQLPTGDRPMIAQRRREIVYYEQE